MESKWISVEERLPERMKAVWVYPQLRFGYLPMDGTRFFDDYFRSLLEGVTHWAEIEATPPPPPRKMITREINATFLGEIIAKVPHDAEDLRLTFKVPE